MTILREQAIAAPEEIEESAPRPFIVLTDEELDAKIRDTAAVEHLVAHDAWQLVLQALRRKADSCYRQLAKSRDMDEITRLQVWLQFYGDIKSSVLSFLEIKEEVLRERAHRLRGPKSFIDRWRSKRDVLAP